MDFEKCILILKRAIQKLNINMYHLQGEANTKSVIDLLTQIDDEIGKTPKPRTNFDKITENEWTLAKFIIDTVTHCQFNNCEDCPLYEADGCSRQEKVKEWLQKEIDDVQIS